MVACRVVGGRRVCEADFLRCQHPAVKYHKGICSKRKGTDNILEKRRIGEVVDRINDILYHPSSDQTDPEILEITILATKQKHLDFLKEAKTKWPVVGDWKDFHEKNLLAEVQFKDSNDERYGKELMGLLNELNDRLIGEELLYARTVPIEESTLD
jgi:hypothetical protein